MRGSRSAFLAALALGLALHMPSAGGANTDSEIRDLLLSPEQWLARTHGQFFYSSDIKKPRFSLETIQPLFLSEDLRHTLFVQGRLSYENKDWMLSAGVGYRMLMPGNEWLAGLNVWYDRMWKPVHARWGVGGELIGGYLTFRANYYNAITGWKTIEDTSTTRIEERALDGFDISVDAPLPYMPWARVTVGYYMWDAYDMSNIKGFRGELTVDVNDFVAFNAGINADNKDTTAFVGIRLSLGAPAGKEFTMERTGLTQAAFVSRDLRRHVLDPVKRHHRIVLQRRTINKESGETPVSFKGRGVVIGRS